MRLVSRTQNRALRELYRRVCLRRLSSSGRRTGRGSSTLFGGRKVARDLILPDFEHDEFVRRHARTATDVELHGLAGGLVFLFDGAVIDEDGHGVLGFFLIGFVQRDLDGADLLRGLTLGDLKFVIIAVAAALELFEVVAIV